MLWAIIILYVFPGMITTWLFPQFIEYNGGMDAVNNLLHDVDEHHIDLSLTQATAILSFIPILNIFAALPLVYWYICIPKS